MATVRSALLRLGGSLQVEDWLLAIFVALAVPALFDLQGGGGPFDSGRPIDGVLRLTGFAGALVCLVTRSPDQPARSMPPIGSAMPFLVCGLMLVGASACDSLGVDGAIGILATWALAGHVMYHPFDLPVLSKGVRRALILPYVLTAGGFFVGLMWTFFGRVGLVDETVRYMAENPAQIPSEIAAIPVLIALVAAIYAMLVYAPRQVVEREGSRLTWLVRFCVFVVGLAFGLSWLSVLGI